MEGQAELTIEPFIGFVADVLNMSDDDVRAQAQQEGGIDLLKQKYTSFVEQVKKNKFEEGKRKGSKALTDTNKKLIESFGIDGIESIEAVTIDEIVEKAKAKLSSNQSNELTDEQVKRTKVYADLLSERDNVTNAFNQQIEALKQGFERENRMRTMNDFAMQALAKDANSIIISADETRKKGQINFYLSQFQDIETENLSDGRIVIVKDGAIVEKANKHPLTLEEYAAEKLKLCFDYKIAEQRSSAGAGKANTGANQLDYADITTIEGKIQALRDLNVNTSLTEEQKRVARDKIKQLNISQ